MSEALQIKINPVRMASRGEALSGSIALADLPRLAGLLARPSGDARIDLDFGTDRQGVHYIRGEVSAELALVCQRCMEAVEYEIRAEVCLGILFEGGELPEPYEPLVLAHAQDRVLVSDIVEDELMLRLPMIAMHDVAICESAVEPDAEPVAADSRPGPFSVLNQLRTDRDGSV